MRTWLFNSLPYLLNLPSLSPGASWWQAETADAAACPYTGREHILCIKLPSLEFAGIQIGRMFRIFRVATMSFINHRVKYFGKDLVKCTIIQ